MHKKTKLKKRSIQRIVSGQEAKRCRDALVLEEPFTLLYRPSDGSAKSFASTMRTPGEDLELAWGMMYSEGLVRCRREINRMSFCSGGGPNELNRLVAELRLTESISEERLRHRPSGNLPQSACGLCGTSDLSDPKSLLNWVIEHGQTQDSFFAHSGSTLGATLRNLQAQTPIFDQTGASHACLIEGPDRSVWAVAEDVGRHNACDKAIGKLLMEAEQPDATFILPRGSGLLFSSRLSFELAAKAVRAGASWVASVGAPTELAIELLSRARVTSFGFVSESRFNCYTGGTNRFNGSAPRL